MNIPIHFIIVAVCTLIGWGMAAYGGWEARGVSADRDAYHSLADQRAETITLQGAALTAEQDASTRGAAYAAKAANLKPIIATVHSETTNTIKEITPCPLPVSAVKTLTDAASAANQ